jgi:hypothetical protein
MLSRHASCSWIFTSLAALAVAGCAASEPRQADVPVSATGPSPLTGMSTDGEAERLVVKAASCWMGGLWSDALGEPDTTSTGLAGAEDARAAAIRQRCADVITQVYGVEDAMRYKQLRAVEPRLVDDLVARIRTIAMNDRADRSQAEALVTLLRSVADAARENVMARGAADDVKRDYRTVSSPDERATDKVYAARALTRVTGIERLLSLDDGGLTHEARALGLLCALDRLEIARGLPKHLKVLAVGGPFAAMFGVAPPPVPDDPAAPIKSGAWPGYLAAVADAAGHAIPAATSEPIDRETLAWGGVLQAFADRLRVEAGAVSPHTTLPRVLDRVAYRLENENRMTRALIGSERRAER